jgi:hypothetical protein
VTVNPGGNSSAHATEKRPGFFELKDLHDCDDDLVDVLTTIANQKRLGRENERRFRWGKAGDYWLVRRSGPNGFSFLQTDDARCLTIK